LEILWRKEKAARHIVPHTILIRTDTVIPGVYVSEDKSGISSGHIFNSIDVTMSDEPAQNGTVPDDVETEETPKPRSGEEAKAARSMDAMQTNKEPTTAADVDDAKLANVHDERPWRKADCRR
jgi:hypothetical protein